MSKTQMGISHFCFSLFFLSTFLSAQNVRGNAELRALMELKASLDPENKLLTSWTSDRDPCSGSFEGVACNEHHKVANISLQGKGLAGTVSPAVAELKCLSGLYLHYNSLSGGIPKEIANLTELSDLYLNVNKLSGTIPPEISNMGSLEVLELCCNQLTGNIPTQVGSMKKLSVMTLQYNRLTGKIPSSLGDLGMLRRLDLSFNHLLGTIPAKLADIPNLEVLYVQNNSLSGFVPSGLKRLGGEFQCENNPGLCGIAFPTLRACTSFDNLNINQLDPYSAVTNITDPTNNPAAVSFQPHCNHTHCSNSSKLVKIAVFAGVSTVTITLIVAGFVKFFCYRRQKQKIGNTCDSSDDRLSTDQAKEFYRNGASPLVSLEYSNGWDPLGDGRNGIGFFQEHLNSFKFNMEEVESATQCFSELNLLGKSSFSYVYKGNLRDGSRVAIRSINVTSCKSEEAEFVKGLNLLTSLRHENLVKLRGFCCSRGRNECYLIYDFATRGNLSKYLDVENGSDQVLDWSTRISILNGIAKGIQYLHSSEANRPAIIHRNISVEKIVIDQHFKPLIEDSGIYKLLADDIVFSALKTSAAMGYLAPEYVTTGRFTEKTDIFAFGVIILQILSGKMMLTNLVRLAAESCQCEDFIDPNLRENFSESEAIKLGKLASVCMHEHPDQRPSMEEVIKELST
ncbi:LRR_1 domain-containing protein/Pkinase_Tyr domain-containing protein/LRRNT_2 domain-containing protein/LRR_8 domain-containing protein [Cephalotus follicularis]|uniref:LRR_1 domain-containing protein/Pkinase_Tyr domain-containing protein/LRRNT_2 domain-containing protein/LRR_8 domain-containing protein n=1 Tax=Cephalotus follicularis TaxID=3775 RepID=A0A1Q3CR73_CEPFO|nr:LRR_1 domain-containing protein/Pkinase_Tyr domain-containing protein/LRRNT_2 domain-containing protein/LRR_8 domain-containing protein [Cephalotus follicularis]